MQCGSNFVTYLTAVKQSDSERLLTQCNLGHLQSSYVQAMVQYTNNNHTVKTSLKMTLITPTEHLTIGHKQSFDNLQYLSIQNMDT